jgi:cell division protease FtsH
MGGRAAEEIVFNHFSTGAANDLKQATEQARRMVCSYGMSERIGPIVLSDDTHDVFLGRDFVSRKEYSDLTAHQVDQEIADLLRTLYAEAKELLTNHRDTLERISEALLERETLDRAELKLLMEGQTLPPFTPVVLAATEPPAARSPERTKAFPGDKLPDPEPVPG